MYMLTRALFELRPVTYKKRELLKATEKKRSMYMKRVYDVGYWVGVSDAAGKLSL